MVTDSKPDVELTSQSSSAGSEEEAFVRAPNRFRHLIRSSPTRRLTHGETDHTTTETPRQRDAPRVSEILARSLIHSQVSLHKNVANQVHISSGDARLSPRHDRRRSHGATTPLQEQSATVRTRNSPRERATPTKSPVRHKGNSLLHTPQSTQAQASTQKHTPPGMILPISTAAASDADDWMPLTFER